MQDFEMDAYLGDYAGRIDADKRRTLKATLERLEQRWQGLDFTDERTEAGNAATALAFGDSTADGIADEYRAARAAERTARLRLTGTIVYLSESGVPEVAIAERLGVARMTVRKALGK